MDDRKGSCLQKKILKKKIMFVGPELVHCLLVQNFMKYLKLFGVLFGVQVWDFFLTPQKQSVWPCKQLHSQEMNGLNAL